MLKLLICIVSGFAVGLVCLLMRQQQLEMNHRYVTLHRQIEAQQARLWSQQLQISMYTTPQAVVKSTRDLPLTPEGDLAPQAGHWTSDE
jgi:hypothetical protein